MKKQFIHFLLIIATGIFLSSCSTISTMQITKRHYRSGYYVDFHKKGNTSPALPITARQPEKQISPTQFLNEAKPENPIINTSVSKTTNGEYVTNLRNTISEKRKASNINTVSYTTSSSKSVNLKPTMSINTGNTEAGSEVHAQVNVNVSYAVIIICAIFIPPLGVALMYGINSYFWIDLILTLLFFFPGMIFALIVVLM